MIPTPKSIKQALDSSHAKEWSKAIEAEWHGLWDYGVFEHVKYEDVPKDKRIMMLLWQFKVKPDRFKARCCLNGKQEAHSDYGDIFSPVCRHTTFRTLLWKALQESWNIGQCDVHMAYLNAVNPKEQYVHCPPGWKKPGYCLRVRKMLYGLHASGKEWNQLLTRWMVDVQGFVQSSCDECLFIKTVHPQHNRAQDRDQSRCRQRCDESSLAAGEGLYVCLYVDDLLYTGDTDLVKGFKTTIGKRFKIKHLDATTFLGLSIDYDKTGGTLSLGQEKYTESILRRFGMLKCNAATTPMATSKKLEKQEGQCKNPDLQTLYRQKVGCMMFLAVSTRPDISYAVKELSRHLVHPAETHMQAAKRVLRYLRGTIDHCLVYTREQKVHVYGSADADWAGEAETAKSTTGYGFSAGSGVLTWKAATQSIVSHSSTEAELIALDDASREMAYLEQLFACFDIPVKMPVPIFQDNQSTIRLVQGGHFNPRTKHMNVRYHYCHNLVTEGKVVPEYLPTDQMPSDVLTKALPEKEHRRHSDVLLGRSLPKW
jgi:hypothetical protein